MKRFAHLKRNTSRVTTRLYTLDVRQIERSKRFKPAHLRTFNNQLLHGEYYKVHFYTCSPAYINLKHITNNTGQF